MAVLPEKLLIVQSDSNPGKRKDNVGHIGFNRESNILFIPLGFIVYRK